MFQHQKFEQLNDFFSPLSSRQGRSIYFYHITGYSDAVADFLKKYYDAARRTGVIIDGRIKNPDPANLAYFTEIMGNSFQMSRAFLNERLRKWLPRMSDHQREAVVTAMYATLDDMRQSGKNDNMLRNAYIKYMCWLYYKFERIVNQLGAENPPKILYDGEISNYELQLLIVLSRAGADILLLERSGDQAYRALDASSMYSRLYEAPGLRAFPPEFNLKWIQAELTKEMNRQRLYGTLPTISACTNAWLEKPEMNAVLQSIQTRGNDPTLFYNAFLCQYGVEDKLCYTNDLFAFYQNLKTSGRKVCVVNGDIESPTPEEIARIKRKNYTSIEQMAAGLAANIQYTANIELQRLMSKSFIDICLEEGDKLGAGALNKLTNRAVYLLCWLNRYIQDLFSNWKMPEVAVFILFGKCDSENTALFLRFLSRLPIDVLLMLPNLNSGSTLRDRTLLEIHFNDSIQMSRFPVSQNHAQVTTAAYQAERDLDTLMYQGTGLYRNQQYAKANSVMLQTMYEEISILWDQELKYRPSFGTVDDTVNLPVICAKVCGVKDGQTYSYWQGIRQLVTQDTVVVKSAPWVNSLDANPMKPFATQFLRNGRLLKSKIKSHSAYPYGILRDEVQDHLLDKIQLLLDQKLIKGTYENGTEYTIISTALNLNKDILRKIQRFDFTKKNPKLIFILTGEKTLSLEDSILTAFLSLVGFDILFYVPTGYQCIEKHFTRQFANECQIGEYLYDLSVPDLNHIQESNLSPLRKLFGRSI